MFFLPVLISHNGSERREGESKDKRKEEGGGKETAFGTLLLNIPLNFYNLGLKLHFPMLQTHSSFLKKNRQHILLIIFICF